MRRLIIAFILLLGSGTNAELIINEVMYNEPEGLTSLEWIELYNNSDSSVLISAYQLDVDGSMFTLPSHSVAGREYILIVRKLYKGTGTTSFESYWGNDSDVWGDNPLEMHTGEPVEISFSFSNSQGSVRLLQNASIISSVEWNDAGLDGVSIERKYSDSSYFEQSVSREYSTPGNVNSVTPLPFDISLDYVKPYYDGSFLKIIVSVTNRSLDTLSHFSLRMNNYDYFNDVISFNDIFSQFIGTVVDTLFVYAVYGIYDQFDAYLSYPNQNDDRPENDTVSFTMIGSEYPPLVINEFLANPTMSSEGIELYNRSDSIVDLVDWMIGDALTLHSITDSSFLIQPNSYVVLYPDQGKNNQNYGSYAEADWSYYIPMDSWATLNNDADSIRLVDHLGVTADLVYYTSLYENNFTACRENPRAYADNWYRSLYNGGSFGRENRIFKYNATDLITLSLESKYYEYGYAPLRIYLSYPEAESYSIKIFNREGQVVAVIAENEKLEYTSYIWTGETLSGERLPIGMYILVVEAEGIAKKKDVFVVAR